MASWAVTGQVTDQVRVTDAGQTIEGVQVYFTTGEGQTGSVFVPDTQYTEAKVRQMIEARANRLDAVFAMTAGGE